MLSAFCTTKPQGSSCWFSLPPRLRGEALPPRYALGPMEHLDFDCLFLGPTLLAICIRRAHEGAEQRVRLERLRLEFRMELASDEVRMVRQLHHLDIGPIGGRP